MDAAVVEDKFVTVSGNGTSNASGTLILLNGCAAGTGDTERLGRVVWNLEVDIEMFVRATQTSDFRAILVQDWSPNGSLPSVTDILDMSSANPCLGEYLPANEDRFSLLRDMKVPLSTNGPQNYVVKFHQALQTETVFSGTTNSISSLTTNAYYLLVIGYDLGGTTVFPTYSYYSRLYYTDQ